MHKQLSFHKSVDGMTLLAAFIAALEKNEVEYVISDHIDKVTVEIVGH